jgi:hypothetical protein
MSQAPNDPDGVDFGYAPGEVPAEQHQEASTVLRSIWGDEYEPPPGRPRSEPLQAELTYPDLPEPRPAADDVDAQLADLSARIDHLDRTVGSLLDRLATVEAQAKASAEVSREVAAILREILKPRPVGS